MFAVERCTRTMKLSRTIKLLAAVGAASLVAFGVVGIMLLLARRDGFSARAQPSSIEAAIAGSMRRMAVPAHAAGLKNPVQTTPEVLRTARTHWADHCAICHANDGSGDTTIGRNLYPKAPDMRGERTQRLSDGELYFSIENGIRLTGMPAWGQGRDDSQDSWKLVALIRRLSALTPQELREMERLNPVSREELEEEAEEADFLRGDKVREGDAQKGHTH